MTRSHRKSINVKLKFSQQPCSAFFGTSLREVCITFCLMTEEIRLFYSMFYKFTNSFYIVRAESQMALGSLVRTTSKLKKKQNRQRRVRESSFAKK